MCQQTQNIPHQPKNKKQHTNQSVPVRYQRCSDISPGIFAKIRLVHTSLLTKTFPCSTSHTKQHPCSGIIPSVSQTVYEKSGHMYVALIAITANDIFNQSKCGHPNENEKFEKALDKYPWGVYNQNTKYPLRVFNITTRRQ